MPTNTAVVLPAARQDPRQVLNTLKKTVNYNDAGIASGVPFDNGLPQGAFITNVMVEIVTAFNGTTPQLTVGTVGAGYNNIVAAGDLNEAALGVTEVTRAYGRSLASANDVVPYAKLAITDTTTGVAVIVITYEGGFSS